MSRIPPRRAWLPYLLLTGTLFFTVLYTHYASITAKAKDDLRFENAAQQAKQDIEHQIDVYVALLRSGTGLFVAGNPVSKEEFRNYVNRIDLRYSYPGVQGMGYSARVSAAELPALVENMRRQGVENFAIRPNQTRAEYHAIVYLEPSDERNQAAIGFDMFTEATRRAAMERARDTGQPAASGRVILVQEIDRQKQAGFLIYMPVYAGGRVPETIEERRSQLQGFVYSPFRADDLLRGIFRSQRHLRVDVQVYDGMSVNANHLLHQSSLSNHGSRFQEEKRVHFAGRTWTLLIRSRPELDADSETGRVPYIAMSGFLFSLVVFLATRSLVQARSSAERAERAARQSEIRFRGLVEQSPLSTQIVAPDGRTTQVNKAWEELWGMPLDGLSDYNILQDQQLLEQGLMPLLRQAFDGEAVTTPPILYDPQRSTPEFFKAHPELNLLPKWVSASVYPVKDEAGNLREIVIVHEDITARKQAEEVVRQSNERLGLLYAMSSSLLTYQQPTAFLSSLFSQLSQHLRLEVYVNYLLEEDQRLHLNAHGGISDAIAAQVEWIAVGESVSGKVAQQKTPIVLEDIATLPPEESTLVRSLDVSAYACYPLVSRGRLMGTLAFGTRNRPQFNRDELVLMQVVGDQVATALERSQLVRELQQQTEELSHANRMKDEFLSVLSHELRTPLNAMLGWTTLLRQRQFDPPTTARALETIDRNAHALNQLIEEILDVSRIITGKLRLKLGEVTIAPLLESAIATIQPTADAKEIQIKTQIEPLLPTIVGDANRLQQVMWNLLSNAIKFTPKGGKIWVDLRHHDSSVRLQVKDSGQGISPEFLPHVFDRFRQADSSTTRAHGGLGLGLAIVRHLVELHGGTVRADSLGEGQGATFTVQLPVQAMLPSLADARSSGQPTPVSAAASNPALDQTINAGLAGVSILVVDDEQDARELVKAVLSDMGATVLMASNAKEAFELIQNARPTLMISDIGMPSEDGYQLMQRIRQLTEEQGGRTPAIALTAYARTEDRHRAIGAGFQNHMAKPVKPQELVQQVMTLVR